MEKKAMEMGSLEFAKDKGFFYSYNVIFELDISEHAKIVYLYLCRRADGSSKTFPSYATMASACSMSRSTAIRAMKELLLEGLLLRKRQQNGKEFTSNQYFLYEAPDEEAKKNNIAQLEQEEWEREQERAKTIKKSDVKKSSTKKSSIRKKKPGKNFQKQIAGTGVSFSIPPVTLPGQMELKAAEEKTGFPKWYQSDTRGSPK